MEWTFFITPLSSSSTSRVVSFAGEVASQPRGHFCCQVQFNLPFIKTGEYRNNVTHIYTVENLKKIRSWLRQVA